MASEWKTVRLGDLTMWASGGTPSKANPVFWNGDIPWISASSMKTPLLRDSDIKLTKAGLDNGSRLAETNSILLLVRGSELHKRIPVGFVTRPVAFNQDVKALKVRSEMISEYLFYWLLGNENMLLAKVEHTGIGAGKLDTEVLKNLPVLLPSLSEQRAIASVLGALDDKIEVNRRMNATLEAMARALFQSWFVDFDPVRAKSEGRQPEGMDADTAALFPAEFEESELGMIPKGWKAVSLGMILDILETGRRPKGGVSGYSTGVPSVGAESINGIGVFDYSKTKFIPTEFYQKTTSGRIEHLDVLLYKDGGKPGEFRPRVGMFGYGFPFEEFCINEHVFRMRAKSVGQHYLYFAISDDRVLLDFANKGGKAAIPGINQSDVRSAQILQPSTEVISRLESVFQPICKTIIKNFAESRTLAALRDTLLPKLLSGELRVGDLEPLPS